jgi:hypothetical protein
MAKEAGEMESCGELDVVVAAGELPLQPVRSNKPRNGAVRHILSKIVRPGVEIGKVSVAGKERSGGRFICHRYEFELEFREAWRRW